MTTERKKHHPIRRTRPAGAAKEREPAGPSEEDELPKPRRERRALSHVGGEVEFSLGNPDDHERLRHALDVSAEEKEVMADVHGFHSYPARLHPVTARRLIESFSQPGDRVLDPFCGSGTVVVEARAAGRHGLGSDLNPLAVELSWLKSRGPSRKLIAETVGAAARIAEVAEERRVAKADPYARYSEEDRERYPIHTLLELDSIAHGISLVGRTEPARMLRLVVSSLLTKLAHSEGDTTRRHSPRRLPSGFAIQLFLQKTEELARRLEAYLKRLPDGTPRAYVFCEDARELSKIEHDSVDLIVTSPPYPGVYDYLDHHLHRIQWLGLHAGRLSQGELGARRTYRRLHLEEAKRLWQAEIGEVLYELRRTLSPAGRGILVIADSVIDRQPLYADQQIHQVAEQAGIDITCIASQQRPLFLHGADRAFSERPRMEHVVIFRPGDRPHRRPGRSPAHARGGSWGSQREGRSGSNDQREGRPRQFQEERFPHRTRRDDGDDRRPTRDDRRPRRWDDNRPPGRFSNEGRERNEGRGPRDRPPRRDDGNERRPKRWDDVRPPRQGLRESHRGERNSRDDGRPARRDAQPGYREANERGGRRPQRASQDRTWDSRPKGAGNPRSKSSRKPK